MGVGDSIMVSGEAKHIYETHGLRTVVVNEGRPVWSDMWKNLPYIMRPEKRYLTNNESGSMKKNRMASGLSFAMGTYPCFLQLRF